MHWNNTIVRDAHNTMTNQTLTLVATMSLNKWNLQKKSIGIKRTKKLAFWIILMRFQMGKSTLLNSIAALLPERISNKGLKLCSWWSSAETR